MPDHVATQFRLYGNGCASYQTASRVIIGVLHCGSWVVFEFLSKVDRRIFFPRATAAVDLSALQHGSLRMRALHRAARNPVSASLTLCDNWGGSALEFHSPGGRGWSSLHSFSADWRHLWPFVDQRLTRASNLVFCSGFSHLALKCIPQTAETSLSEAPPGSFHCQQFDSAKCHSRLSSDCCYE